MSLCTDPPSSVCPSVCLSVRWLMLNLCVFGMAFVGGKLKYTDYEFEIWSKAKNTFLHSFTVNS